MSKHSTGSIETPFQNRSIPLTTIFVGEGNQTLPLNRLQKDDMSRHFGSDLERRQREWDHEVERLRRQIFRGPFDDDLFPSSSSTSSSRRFSDGYSPSPGISPRRASAGYSPSSGGYSPSTSYKTTSKSFTTPLSTRSYSPPRSGSYTYRSNYYPDKYGTTVVETATPKHTAAVPVPPPDRFAVEFDMNDYEPEDIKVRVEDSKLLVEAAREETVNGNTKVKEFSKTIILPPHVDPDMLVSKLNEDNILTVELPLPPTYESVDDGSEDSFSKK